MSETLKRLNGQAHDAKHYALKSLLSECTKEQIEFFNRLHGSVETIKETSMDIAIQQCERTIKENKDREESFRLTQSPDKEMDIPQEFSEGDSFQFGDNARVRVRGAEQRALGKVCGCKGGVIYVCTPHGTIVESGFAWIESFGEGDLEKLKGFEEDRIKQGYELYNLLFEAGDHLSKNLSGSIHMKAC